VLLLSFARERLATEQALRATEKTILLAVFQHFSDANRVPFLTDKETAARFAKRQQLRMALVYLHGRVVLQGDARRRISQADLFAGLQLLKPLLVDGGRLTGRVAVSLALIFCDGVSQVLAPNKRAALIFCRMALDSPYPHDCAEVQSIVDGASAMLRLLR
jgi:hypothetical protein